ncbi:MAG TPA: hypothetical protein VF816_18840 [Rhodocyclaceae bacterium]
MKPLDIDFAWQARSRGRAAGMAALAIAVAVLLAEAWSYASLRAEADLWQADRRRLDRIAATPKAQDSAEDRERLQAELRQANRIIDKLDTPWDALFGTVESAGGDQAILLGVEPDAEKREARLSGEAKNQAAMLDYLRELRRAPALREVHLVGHQINVQDPERPVQFTLQARWVALPAAAKPESGKAGAAEAPKAATPAAAADAPAPPAGEKP